MGMIACRQEISSAVAPSQLFNALLLDADNVLPKIVPQWIKSVELIPGDGGVGSIKKINFGGSSDIKYAKYEIKAGSFPRKYTMIESNITLDKIDKIEKGVKLVAAGSGCICKMSIEYHVKEHRVLTQADINRDKDRAVRFFRAVEKHLLANPIVCA